MSEAHKERTPTVKGQRRVRPSWASWNFTLPAEKPRGPAECCNCGRVSIPHAHYMKFLFCSFQCGKTFLRKRDEQKDTSTYSEVQEKIEA